MGVIKANLPEGLERRFRLEIAKRGGKKGNIEKTVQEAIEMWIEKVEEDGGAT